MRRKRYFTYLVILILNTLLLLVIPEYFIWFLFLLVTGAFICLMIIIIDLFGQTNNWKGALIMLGVGILSYGIAILMLTITDP